MDTQPFTSKEIELIKILQEDIPLTEDPFQQIAEQLDLPEEWIYQTLKRWKQEKKLRGVRAILYHQQAGYIANGMSVWAVPEDQIEKVGEKIASFSAVSHCYQRPTLPDWNYNLYAMIHARSQDEVEATAREISQSVGITDYQILYSVREFKKRSMKYFVSEIEDENESPEK